MFIRAFAAAAVLAAFAVPARSQMGGGCMMTELAKLCPGTAPGSPEFAACAKTQSGAAMANCQAQKPAASLGKTEKTGMSPCADDMKKYCPGMWPGTPEFRVCMGSHMGDVTPACAEFGRKQMGTHEKMKDDDKACIADAKKLCPGLTGTDGPKFMSCMTTHYDKLSPPCQKQFEGAKGGKDGEPGTVECMQALKSVCPDADPGTPEMMKCMVEHREELPPACQKKGKKKK